MEMPPVMLMQLLRIVNKTPVNIIFYINATYFKYAYDASVIFLASLHTVSFSKAVECIAFHLM